VRETHKTRKSGDKSYGVRNNCQYEKRPQGCNRACRLRKLPVRWNFVLPGVIFQAAVIQLDIPRHFHRAERANHPAATELTADHSMQTFKKKIRYGIIGFGGFAERSIAPAIRASANSELVAIQKRSIAVAREKAAALSIPFAFSSVDDLVAHPDVDAVFIVSANAAHCSETVSAARAGKHVLVEKPMAMNTQETRRMIEACEQSNVKLMVGHMIRFSPLAQRMREIVQSGLIGKVVFARSEYIYDARLTERGWLTDRAVAGGGPIFDVGVHCLDTLRFVLDDEVISVKCHAQPSPTDAATERTAIMALDFSRGTLASIITSYDAPTRRSFMEIVGTEGMLSADDFTLGGRTIALQISLRADGTAAEAKREEIAVPNLYIEETTSFSSSILDDTDPMIPGIVGFENQRVLDLAMAGGGTLSRS
jgi:1,5-anhydro-D-fructose reductase (1,5-anhydro-D-mannitol-forming)